MKKWITLSSIYPDIGNVAFCAEDVLHVREEINVEAVLHGREEQVQTAIILKGVTDERVRTLRVTASFELVLMELRRIEDELV